MLCSGKHFWSSNLPRHHVIACWSASIRLSGNEQVFIREARMGCISLNFHSLAKTTSWNVRNQSLCRLARMQPSDDNDNTNTVSSLFLSFLLTVSARSTPLHDRLFESVEIFSVAPSVRLTCWRFLYFSLLQTMSRALPQL
jgi:hypothetical protein